MCVATPTMHEQRSPLSMTTTVCTEKICSIATFKMCSVFLVKQAAIHHVQLPMELIKEYCEQIIVQSLMRVLRHHLAIF